MAYFEIQAMIRGYHQYKGIWDAKFGEQLEYQRETEQTSELAATIEVDGTDCAKGPWGSGRLFFSLLKYRNKAILNVRLNDQQHDNVRAAMYTH